MPQIQHIDIEVRPSQNYQSVGFAARLVFDTPVGLDEAKFEADLAYEELKEIAMKRVSELSASRPDTTVRTETRTTNAGSDDWRIAYKPNGHGSFRYLPTSVMSDKKFVAIAKEKLPELGLDPDDVYVFDDRGGDKGIEAGNEYYCAGKIKVKADTKLAAAMQGKAIVGNIDFDDSGNLHLSLSRDGKAALQAMTIADQLAGSSINF